MTISNEAVEAAAKSLWDVDREHNDREYEDCREGTKRHLRREARAALEAAAPFIRAEALEDAADEIDAQRDAANPDRKPDEDWSVIDHRAGRFLGKTVAARLLRARAAGMRQG